MIELRIAATNFVLIYALSCSVAGNAPIFSTPSGYLTSSSPTWMHRNQQMVANEFDSAIAATGDEYSAKDKTVSIAGYDKEIVELIEELQKVSKCLYDKTIEVNFYMINKGRYFHIDSVWTDLNVLDKTLNHYNHYFCLNKRYLDQVQRGDNDNRFYLNNLIMLPSSKDLKHILNLGKCKKVKVLNDEIEDTDDKVKIYVIKIDDDVEGDDSVLKDDENINDETAKMCKDLNEHDCLCITNYGDKGKLNTSLEDVPQSCEKEHNENLQGVNETLLCKPQHFNNDEVTQNNEDMAQVDEPVINENIKFYHHLPQENCNVKCEKNNDTPNEIEPLVFCQKVEPCNESRILNTSSTCNKPNDSVIPFDTQFQVQTNLKPESLVTNKVKYKMTDNTVTDSNEHAIPCTTKEPKTEYYDNNNSISSTNNSNIPFCLNNLSTYNKIKPNNKIMHQKNLREKPKINTSFSTLFSRWPIYFVSNYNHYLRPRGNISVEKSNSIPNLSQNVPFSKIAHIASKYPVKSLKNQKIFRKPDSNILEISLAPTVQAYASYENMNKVIPWSHPLLSTFNRKTKPYTAIEPKITENLKVPNYVKIEPTEPCRKFEKLFSFGKTLPFANKGQEKILSGSSHRIPYSDIPIDSKTKPSPTCTCSMCKYPGPYNYFVPVVSEHKKPLTYPVSDNKTKPSPTCTCSMCKYPGPYNYFVPVVSEHKKPLTYPVSDNKTKPSPTCTCSMNKYPGPYNYFVPVVNKHKKPLIYPVSDNKTKPSSTCTCSMCKYPGPYNYFVPVVSEHKKPLTYPVSDNKTKPSPTCTCSMNKYPGPYNYFVPVVSKHKKPLIYPVSDNKTKPSSTCTCSMCKYPGPYNYFVPVVSKHKKPLTYPVSDNKTKPSPTCTCSMNKYPGPYNYFVPACSEHKKPLTYPISDNKTKPSPTCTCSMNKYPGLYNYFVPVCSEHKKPLTYPISDNKTKPSPTCTCSMNKYPGLYNYFVPVCSEHKKPLTYPVSNNKTKPSPTCTCSMNKYPGPYNYFVPVCSEHKKPLTYPVSDNKTKPSPTCTCLMNKYPGLYNYFVPVVSDHKKPLTYPVSTKICPFHYIPNSYKIPKSTIVDKSNPCVSDALSPIHDDNRPPCFNADPQNINSNMTKLKSAVPCKAENEPIQYWPNYFTPISNIEPLNLRQNPVFSFGKINITPEKIGSLATYTPFKPKSAARVQNVNVKPIIRKPERKNISNLHYNLSTPDLPTFNKIVPVKPLAKFNIENLPDSSHLRPIYEEQPRPCNKIREKLKPCPTFREPKSFYIPNLNITTTAPAIEVYQQVPHILTSTKPYNIKQLQPYVFTTYPVTNFRIPLVNRNIPLKESTVTPKPSLMATIRNMDSKILPKYSAAKTHSETKSCIKNSKMISPKTPNIYTKFPIYLKTEPTEVCNEKVLHIPTNLLPMSYKLKPFGKDNLFTYTPDEISELVTSSQSHPIKPIKDIKQKYPIKSETSYEYPNYYLKTTKPFSKIVPKKFLPPGPIPICKLEPITYLKKPYIKMPEENNELNPTYHLLEPVKLPLSKIKPKLITDNNKSVPYKTNCLTPLNRNLFSNLKFADPKANIFNNVTPLYKDNTKPYNLILSDENSKPFSFAPFTIVPKPNTSAQTEPVVECHEKNIPFIDTKTMPCPNKEIMKTQKSPTIKPKSSGKENKINQFRPKYLTPTNKEKPCPITSMTSKIPSISNAIVPLSKEINKPYVKVSQPCDNLQLYDPYLHPYSNIMQKYPNSFAEPNPHWQYYKLPLYLEKTKPWKPQNIHTQNQTDVDLNIHLNKLAPTFADYVPCPEVGKRFTIPTPTIKLAAKSPYNSLYQPIQSPSQYLPSTFHQNIKPYGLTTSKRKEAFPCHYLPDFVNTPIISKLEPIAVNKKEPYKFKNILRPAYHQNTTPHTEPKISHTYFAPKFPGTPNFSEILPLWPYNSVVPCFLTKLAPDYGKSKGPIEIPCKQYLDIPHGQPYFASTPVPENSNSSLNYPSNLPTKKFATDPKYICMSAPINYNFNNDYKLPFPSMLNKVNAIPPKTLVVNTPSKLLSPYSLQLPKPYYTAFTGSPIPPKTNDIVLSPKSKDFGTTILNKDTAVPPKNTCMSTPLSYNFNGYKLPFPSILNKDTAVAPKILDLNTPTKLLAPYSIEPPKPCYTAFTGSPIPAKTNDIVLSPKCKDFVTTILNKDNSVPPKNTCTSTPLSYNFNKDTPVPLKKIVLNTPTKLLSPYSLQLPKPYYTAFTGSPIPPKTNDIVLSPKSTDFGNTTPNFTCMKAIPFETKPRDKILRPHQSAFIRPNLDDKNELKIISPEKKKEFRPLNSPLIEFRPLNLYPFSTLEKQVTNKALPSLSNIKYQQNNIKQSIPLLQSTKPVPFWPKTQMYNNNLTNLPFYSYKEPLIKEKPTILLPPNILRKPQLKQSGSSVVTKTKKPIPLLDNTFIPSKGTVVCTPTVQPVKTNRKLPLNPSPPLVVPIIPEDSFKPSEPGQSLHYKGVKYPKPLVHIPKEVTDKTEIVARPIPTSINENKTPVCVKFNKPVAATSTAKPHILLRPEIFTSLPYATVPEQTKTLAAIHSPEIPILNRNVLKAHPYQIPPSSGPYVHPKLNVVCKKDNLVPLSTFNSKSHVPSISPEAVILSSPPNPIPLLNKTVFSRKPIFNWSDRKPEIKLPFEPINAYTVLPKNRVSKPVRNFHLTPQNSKPLWAINKYDSLKPNKILDNSNTNSPKSIGHQNEFAPIKNSKLISLGMNKPNLFELPNPFVQNLNPTQASIRPNTVTKDPILNAHRDYFPAISTKPKIIMDANKLKLQNLFNELNDTIKRCVNKDNYAKDVLFNDKEDIIIPLTDIGIAKYTPNVSEKCHIIKTNNPYIFLKAWKSKLKLLKVKISFETEYFDSVNFVPVVMWNLPPKYVQKTAEDVITKLYAKPIVVQGVYSLDNSYAIVNGEFKFGNRVVYVLWPTFCGKCVVFHGQNTPWRCNWSQCGV